MDNSGAHRTNTSIYGTHTHTHTHINGVACTCLCNIRRLATASFISTNRRIAKFIERKFIFIYNFRRRRTAIGTPISNPLSSISFEWERMYELENQISIIITISTMDWSSGWTGHAQREIYIILAFSAPNIIIYSGNDDRCLSVCEHADVPTLTLGSLRSRSRHSYAFGK